MYVCKNLAFKDVDTMSVGVEINLDHKVTDSFFRKCKTLCSGGVHGKNSVSNIINFAIPVKAVITQK